MINKFFNRYYKLIIFLLFIGAVLTIIFVLENTKQNLKVYFLDVGQGDSIYVRETNTDILIDGGPGDAVLTELGKWMPFYDQKIEYIILTHPHEDHYFGLIKILKKYEIGEIILTDTINLSQSYEELLKVIRDKNIRTIQAKDLNKLDINDKLAIDFLWPKESYKEIDIDNLNNTSIVCEIGYGNFEIMLTGDAEKEVQEKLIKSEGLALKSDVLKIAHHGSDNAADENFVKIVSPQLAVISVGSDNKFGHPGEDILAILDKLQIKLLRTDLNGTIIVESDGVNFWTKAP